MSVYDDLTKVLNQEFGKYKRPEFAVPEIADALIAAGWTRADTTVTEWGVYVGSGSYLGAPNEATAQSWVEDPCHSAQRVVTHRRIEASVTHWAPPS